MVYDIIPLIEDNDVRPTTYSPVSDNDSSVDSSLVHPPTESEGYFVSDDADNDHSNSPPPASNIPPPSKPSPTNTSQE